MLAQLLTVIKPAGLITSPLPGDRAKAGALWPRCFSLSDTTKAPSRPRPRPICKLMLAPGAYRHAHRARGPASLAVALRAADWDRMGALRVSDLYPADAWRSSRCIDEDSPGPDHRTNPSQRRAPASPAPLAVLRSGPGSSPGHSRTSGSRARSPARAWRQRRPLQDDTNVAAQQPIP